MRGFFQLQMHENIFGTFYGYIAHLMDTFMTASSLGTSKTSSCNFTIFVNSTLILNGRSGLENFFLSITDEFVTSLLCSAKWLKKKSSPWSKVGPIKSMRGWYVICMCVCANYSVREGQGRERCLDLVWAWERLLVIAFFVLAQPLSSLYSYK